MDKEIVITGVIVIILGLVGLLYAFSSYLTLIQTQATLSTIPVADQVITPMLDFFKNQIIAVMIIAISTIVAGAGIISVGKKD